MLKNTDLISADLKVGYLCNNNCVFCIQKDFKLLEGNLPYNLLKIYIKEMKENGANSLVLTGGEPTISDHFIDLILYAKDLGFEIFNIQTNLRRFSNSKFLNKTLNALNGTTYGFLGSIHSPYEDVHNFLTGDKDAYKESIQAMKNLIEVNAPLAVNYVLTKYNYKDLVAMINFLLSYGQKQVLFSFLHGSLNWMDYKDIVVKYEELQPYVLQAIEYVRRINQYNPENFKMKFETIPFCVTVGNKDMCSELDAPKQQLIRGQFYRNTNDFNKIRKEQAKCKVEKCQTCYDKDICEGVYVEYIHHFGKIL